MNAPQVDSSDSRSTAGCVWLKFTQYPDSICYIPLSKVSSVKLSAGRAWVMTEDDGYLLNEQQTVRLLEIIEEGVLSLDIPGRTACE